MPPGLGHVACRIELTLSNLLLIKIKWTWGKRKGLLRVVFELRCVSHPSHPRISSRTEHVNCKQSRREPQRGRIDAIHHLNLIDVF